MQQLQSKTLGFLYAERSRWVLWMPVLFGLGIGIYFLLPTEPHPWQIALGSALAIAILALGVWRRGFLLLGSVALLVALGMADAAWRTQQLAAPALSQPLNYTTVQGVIDEVTPRPEDTKVILREVSIDRLARAETPLKVSLTLRGEAARNGLHKGDHIRLPAGFFPPPKPAFPGSYQFDRHFYFRQIGANGYSFGMAMPEVLEKAQEETGFSGWLAAARQYIFDLFMKRMGAREGSVAAALTMGEQQAIPKDIFDSMRDSGLAHVLSISGLHLALAAGIFYVCIRYGLAAIPFFALRFNIKKVAAAVGLLGAFAYLLLAGAPIPAQRSYVMIALVLLAVLFDRQVTPMRSLALAAMMILVWLPESILNPSFQLSFAATVALVAYYEHWRESDREVAKPYSRGRKFAAYWWGIIVTSGVATVATTPFILHHFEGFPIYSILGNLMSLSLVSFWIMPVIVLILVLLPFGAAEWLLPVLKLGIQLMIGAAEWVASLPMAVVDLPPLSTGGLMLCTLGGIWLCLWQNRWRHVGWLPVLLGLGTLFFYQPPDIILSGDGKRIAMRVGKSEMAMLRGRPDGFQQEQWRRFARVDAFTTVKKAEAGDALRCDRHGCLHHWQGETTSVAYDREALQEDCGETGRMIAPEWSVYGELRQHCAAQVIDRRQLAESHGMALWLGKNQKILTVRQAIGQRPWNLDATSPRR